QPVDVFQAQAAIVERAPRALRHQVGDGHAVGHLAKIRFRHADDRGATPLEPVHHAPSTGVNTGKGSSSLGLWTRKRTRCPMRTSSGAMSSTRLIRRNPSSQSISATLKGLPSAGCTTVVA